MTRQDVLNAVYTLHLEKYDQQTAIQALRLIGANVFEIEMAEELSGRDPDEDAFCKCWHKKKDHDETYACLLCGCKDFQYNTGAR